MSPRAGALEGWFSALLVAFAFALLPLVSSCSKPRAIDRMQSYVAGIEDPVRAAEMRGLADKLDGELASLRADITSYETRIRKMNANYDVTNDQIASVFDAFETVQRQHRADILAALMEMRSASTPKEWKELSKIQIDLVKESMADARMAGEETE